MLIKYTLVYPYIDKEKTITLEVTDCSSDELIKSAIFDDVLRRQYSANTDVYGEWKGSCIYPFFD